MVMKTLPLPSEKLFQLFMHINDKRPVVVCSELLSSCSKPLIEQVLNITSEVTISKAMSPDTLTQDEYAYLCVLLQNIDLGEWKTLEHMIRTSPKKFIAVSSAIFKSPQLNGMTILHSCIRFDPPPSVVDLIVRLSPFSPSCVDCLNRTPLHIAAAIRANPQTIMRLIQACPEACAVQDVDGKTPLHFACDSNCELFEGDEGVVRDSPSLDVITYLATASPESVPMEDFEEASALEYAILSNADETVVKFLMRLTQKQLSGESLSTLQVSSAMDENIECHLMQKEHHPVPMLAEHTDRTVSSI